MVQNAEPAACRLHMNLTPGLERGYNLPADRSPRLGAARLLGPSPGKRTGRPTRISRRGDRTTEPLME